VTLLEADQSSQKPHDAERVQFVDMATLGGNPARIIPAWREFVDAHAANGQPLRGVGEPIWAGRRAPEVLECQLHEALLNLAVDPDTPLWLRCPYDVSALEADILAEAERSHPVLVAEESYTGSRLYGGIHHASESFDHELAEPTVAVVELAFDPSGPVTVTAPTPGISASSKASRTSAGATST